MCALDLVVRFDDENDTMITTHILDTSSGKPASGVQVHLLEREGTTWNVVGSAITNEDGRILSFTDEYHLKKASYRLAYQIGPYFQARDVRSFYEEIIVGFEIENENQHYHVPLLLSPFGYTTYRGS